MTAFKLGEILQWRNFSSDGEDTLDFIVLLITKCDEENFERFKAGLHNAAAGFKISNVAGMNRTIRHCVLIAYIVPIAYIGGRVSDLINNSWAHSARQCPLLSRRAVSTYGLLTSGLGVLRQLRNCCTAFTRQSSWPKSQAQFRTSIRVKTVS